MQYECYGNTDGDGRSTATWLTNVTSRRCPEYINIEIVS